MKKPGYAFRFIVALALCGLIVGAFGSRKGSAAQLQIFTEEYPPITFTKDNKPTGLATEVVEEILRRLNMNTPINIVPWARGYSMALEGPGVVLFAAMRTAQREKLFKWVGSLHTVKTSFYARKGSGINISGLEEAKKLDLIGVPREYYSEQYLKKEGFTNLESVVSPEQMIKMMFGGRVSVMVADNILLPSLVQGANATLFDVELLYTFMTSQSYIIFSLDIPDDTVHRWQNTLNEMKKDGAFAAIYGKWLPGEKPPGVEDHN